MGFTDNPKNLQVLQSTDGDVPNAIEILCRIGQGPVTGTSMSSPARSNTTNNTSSRTPARTNTTVNNNSSSDPKEKILWNMGFHDSALNKEALRRAGGNPEVAAGILIDDKDKLAKAVREKAGSSPLPTKLDPPGSNNNRNKPSENLLDLSDDTSNNNNQQQQLNMQQQQLMLQQQQMQQMQMQNNAFGNNQGGVDQFGMLTRPSAWTGRLVFFLCQHGFIQGGFFFVI